MVCIPKGQYLEHFYNGPLPNSPKVNNWFISKYGPYLNSDNDTAFFDYLHLFMDLMRFGAVIHYYYFCWGGGGIIEEDSSFYKSWLTRIKITKIIRIKKKIYCIIQFFHKQLYKLLLFILTPEFYRKHPGEGMIKLHLSQYWTNRILLWNPLYMHCIFNMYRYIIMLLYLDNM